MKKQSSAIYVGKQYLSRNKTNLHDYAQASHLYEVLSEATKIYLRKNGLSSTQGLSEFLQQCNRGEHVLLKSYGSFSKSSLCKICFLYNFIKVFEIDQSQRNGLDYYQLSRLLCSDFPREFIQKAVALLLPNQDSQNQMYKLLPPKKIQQAIYLFMVYADYIETLTKYFQQEEELDFLEVYRILSQEDMKNVKELTKPPFAIMAQCLLNLMKEKGLLENQQAQVIFVTEQNFEDFIRDVQTTRPDQKIRIDELLRKTLQSQDYVNLFQEHLNMFDSSGSWATENYKILSTKEPTETPLNVKKKGTKK